MLDQHLQQLTCPMRQVSGEYCDDNIHVQADARTGASGASAQPDAWAKAWRECHGAQEMSCSLKTSLGRNLCHVEKALLEQVLFDGNLNQNSGISSR